MPSLTVMAAGLHRRAGRPAAPAAVLVSDPVRLPDPSGGVRRLPRGSVVIVRGADGPGRRAVLGRTLAAGRRRGVGVFVAVLSSRLPALPRGIAGLHLPEGVARHCLLAPVLLWRRAARGRGLSMASHTPAALARAAVLDCRFSLLSPVFPTRSHPGAPCLGPLRAALLAARARRPVVALGGVTQITAPRLARRRFAGLAALDGWAAVSGKAPAADSPASPPRGCRPGPRLEADASRPPLFLKGGVGVPSSKDRIQR